MEFLCWFLRRHFTRKIVMASQNVVCFLRLCTWLCYRSGQIKYGLKFFNLGWLSIPLSPSPNYSWIRARKQDLLRINLQSATKLLLLICYSNRLNYREQKNPHPSPLPFIQLFSIGGSNSGTMLHGGMGEEKLYFPLWKSVKHQKTPLWWSLN